MKKYEINSEGRVVALRDFGKVKAGDIGGFVESEKNLSQSDNAWVFGDARLSDNAWVFGDARVSDNAWVFGGARVSGDAWVFGDAWVSGDARVSDNAWVFGDARVSGDAWVFGDAEVSNSKDYLLLGPVGNDRFITITKSNGKITAGCFQGTFDEFYKAVEEKYGKKSDYWLFESAIKQYLTC